MNRFLQTLALALLGLWTVPVAAQPSGEKVRDLRPSTGIEAEPVSFWHAWPGWAVIGGVVLVAAALGAMVARRYRGDHGGGRSADRIHEAALRDLDRLEALKLPDKGELPRYLSEMSDVLRRYLERRFDVAVTRQTTPEFLESMRGSAAFTPSERELLRDFLERCDLAKFAGLSPSVEQCRELSAAARKLVAQTRKA